MRVDRMWAADLDTVLEIERASFTSPWSRRAFLHELEQNRVADCWVVRDEAADGGPPGGRRSSGRVLGYLCVWAIADEVHVTNLAVDPAWRRQGVAHHLLGTLLEYYRGRGAVKAILEVRPANLGARRLYEAFGFHEVGLRRGYYFDTGEDALLLEANLGQATGPTAALELPAPAERFR
jgi:ribosomal-protein-alanine N-acetyltransferase